MLPVALFSSLLLAVALGAMLLHQRVWKTAQAKFDDPAALGFLRRRHRRRMQIAGLFGLLAVVLFAGHGITAPVPLLFHGLGMLAILVWIVLLAVADALATRGHFYEMSRRQLADAAAEQVKLARELHDDRDENDVV
jgi:hypothetical protein